MLCYELTPGARYEDSFYSFAVPRCRALDRHYDDAFNDDGTLVDGANAFTVFEVIIRDPLTDWPVKPEQKKKDIIYDYFRNSNADQNRYCLVLMENSLSEEK